jgi:protein PhnA
MLNYEKIRNEHKEQRRSLFTLNWIPFVSLPDIRKSNMEVKDSNGNILADGDSVTVIKDLKVRGSSDVIKRGTMVKNIRLTDDPAEIDCRVNKTAMVLRTEFVRKA